MRDDDPAARQIRRDARAAGRRCTRRTGRESRSGARRARVSRRGSANACGDRRHGAVERGVEAGDLRQSGARPRRSRGSARGCAAGAAAPTSIRAGELESILHSECRRGCEACGELSRRWEKEAASRKDCCPRARSERSQGYGRNLSQLCGDCKRGRRGRRPQTRGSAPHRGCRRRGAAAERRAHGAKVAKGIDNLSQACGDCKRGRRGRRPQTRGSAPHRGCRRRGAAAEQSILALSVPERV